MKKLLLLMLSFLPYLNAIAQQDSEGYTDVTRQLRSGYILRQIQSPYIKINNKVVVDKKDDSDVCIFYYNELTSTVLKSGVRADTYKIGFSIENNEDFRIFENARLLIKLKDEQIITLNAPHDFDSDTLSNGKYQSNIFYSVTSKQLKQIIKKNVSKFRIEIMGGFIDVEPDFDVAEITKKYQNGLYDRFKNNRDSFISDF